MYREVRIWGCKRHELQTFTGWVRKPDDYVEIMISQIIQDGDPTLIIRALCEEEKKTIYVRMARVGSTSVPTSIIVPRKIIGRAKALHPNLRIVERTW